MSVCYLKGPDDPAHHGVQGAEHRVPQGGARLLLHTVPEQLGGPDLGTSITARTSKMGRVHGLDQ